MSTATKICVNCKLEKNITEYYDRYASCKVCQRSKRNILIEKRKLESTTSVTEIIPTKTKVTLPIASVRKRITMQEEIPNNINSTVLDTANDYEQTQQKEHKMPIDEKTRNTTNISIAQITAIQNITKNLNGIVPENNHETIIPETCPNEYLYVLSSPDNEDNSKYKVGKHVGDINKLIARYKTFLVVVRVFRFVRINKNLQKHETAVHKLLKEFRISSSEWYQIDRQKLLDIFDNYIDKIRYGYSNEFINSVLKLHSIVMDGYPIDDAIVGTFNVAKALSNMITPKDKVSENIDLKQSNTNS